MNTNTMELNLNEMETVNGGFFGPNGMPAPSCYHDHTVPTGEEREDSRFFFWSKHQHEHYCTDCGHYIWVDDD